MAFAAPVWLAVHAEFVGNVDAHVQSFALPQQPRAPSRTLLDGLDDQSLFDNFHLTRPCISFILDLLHRQLTRDRLPDQIVEGMVLLALNYYAKGTMSADLQEKTGITNSPGVIAQVSEQLSVMAAQLIAFPQTRQDQEALATVNQRCCGTRRVLGVLGTVHFRTRESSETSRSTLFLNTYGYKSVVCQVVCDLSGNLLSVERCQVGSTPNHELWASSTLRAQRTIGPEYWLIVGRGYNQTPNLLPAWPQTANPQQDSFNGAHDRALAVLSRTLGHMKRRFKILQLLGSVDQRLDSKQQVIEACCVLHNLANQFSVPIAPGAATDLQHPV